MEEYIIRKYKDGDEKEINDLFNEIFHETRSLKEWSWKFQNGPLGHVNISFVAESKGKIVGQYANLPLRFKYKEKILRVAFPVDNFVRPEFRGGMKGILKEMFEYQNQFAPENKIVSGFGFPNKEAYIIGKRILKYRDVGKIQVLFRRCNWFLAVKNKFPWFPPPILKLIQSFSSMGFKLLIWMKDRENLKGIEIRAIDSFDERFDLFWDKAKEQYGIIGVRDQRYLNWRYNRPGSKYQIYIAETENEVVGYIVTGVKRNGGMTIGYIIDLLVMNTSGVIATLIREALYGLISQKVDFVLCWVLPNTEAYGTLRKFEFIEREDFPSVNIVYYIFNSEEIDEAFLKEVKNWYLTMGDSDTF